ncbi:HAD family hydrolase [Actinomycetospora termitidis]|uniref:Haloacid dehalogenase-like hydrolase n=1 Tax=Actinomycetospora termitidis TaxID=3053470 RepID=A0ABT7M5I3_9PSEU|nr:HAD family hydrolase [Actinomycetospora sp. Odt1-22]MDL5155932.1 haloacid dehalogenase-like hydrolase [Actinomycetospora sp. Odt1-22]
MRRPVGVCWDIDGTLLRGGRVGGDVLRDAFVAVAGHEPPQVPMGGMTDHLVAEAFRDGLPGPEAEALLARGTEYTEAMVAAIADQWRGRADALAATLTVLPGVREAVSLLAAEPGVDQIVLTGNVREGAELKLTAAGLHPGAFDLDDGVYGSLPGPRATLVHAARTALERRHGREVGLVVVGDTPRDVEAAHAAGAVAVGVATGSSSVDDLAAAGADHVVADLSDPAALVAVVRAAGEDPSAATSRERVTP